MEEPLNDNFTWTNNCTFTFITLVRSHECLWNPLHPDFYNAIAQKNALKKIVIKMKSDSLSIERASLKLKSIKIIYQEELYKSLLDPNYESSVYWYTCADCFMRNAAQTPVWLGKHQKAAPKDDDSLPQFALDNWSMYKELSVPRQRLYRQACMMIMNEILDAEPEQ